jgi:hypothetical protein
MTSWPTHIEMLSATISSIDLGTYFIGGCTRDDLVRELGLVVGPFEVLVGPVLVGVMTEDA